MSERINLMVDDGIGEAMTQLAGGERKRGRWLTEVIASLLETGSYTQGTQVQEKGVLERIENKLDRVLQS